MLVVNKSSKPLVVRTNTGTEKVPPFSTREVDNIKSVKGFEGLHINGAEKLICQDITLAEPVTRMSLVEQRVIGSSRTLESYKDPVPQLLDKLRRFSAGEKFPVGHCLERIQADHPWRRMVNYDDWSRVLALLAPAPGGLEEK